MTLTIYGSRGSMPYYHKNAARLGVNTSCVRLDMNGRIILLDAGTGLAGFTPPPSCGVDILLGHLHLDHIVGLPALSALYEPNDIRIYTKSRGDAPLASQVFGAFRPPYWPVDLSAMCKARLIEITGAFDLGGRNPAGSVKVTPFDANHPDGTTSFRIEGEKTVVYLLDCETAEGAPGFDDLAAFCQNADAVIFDAAYLPEDYPARRGWGHSTYEAGYALAANCGCKRIIFSHFDYHYTDETYKILAGKADNSRFFLAYDGLVISL